MRLSKDIVSRMILREKCHCAGNQAPASFVPRRKEQNLKLDTTANKTSSFLANTGTRNLTHKLGWLTEGFGPDSIVKVLPLTELFLRETCHFHIFLWALIYILMGQILMYCNILGSLGSDFQISFWDPIPWTNRTKNVLCIIYFKS